MRLQLAWTKIIICQDLFLSDYSEFKSLKWNVVVDLIWNLSKVILYGEPVDLKGGWRKLKAARTTYATNEMNKQTTEKYNKETHKNKCMQLIQQTQQTDKIKKWQ